ncbi:Helix-turn-helix domain-containing protein [Thermomonospora echinospora]|uniref:Helix-turn-helix domain-containing protein n=1 Tax=Thermomonospora echinospora TaxID=1992 RepID=A0A1H6D2E4_9ACTN|nr:helix-turn-helix domain-containing protein [Thermomonospora echinospora]SEG79033.1 Helix-turn-helix domain-containing protein [Thermomonospora echinospora]
MTRGLSPAEIRSLPVTIDLVTAGRALGVGRTKAYQLARAGRFPCRVLRIGRSYRVATADLLAVLGLPAQGDPAPFGRAMEDGRPSQHGGED